MDSPEILVVDDNEGNAQYLARVLRNYDIRKFTSPAEALESFRKKPADLIVTDQKMPEITGIELLKACRSITEDFLGLVVSAYTDSEDLIDAVNSDTVYKYITKPFTPDILLMQVHRAWEKLHLSREKARLEQRLHYENTILTEENRQLKEKGVKPSALDHLKGKSTAMKALKEEITTYAPSSSPVLITGETGTGKELIAEALHELSPRRNGPFIKINCTTLSSHLLESELFGYEKGAFTGADRYRAGFFESADGGTLFLDEIGDIDQTIQPKLLRILQFGTFYPVGSREEKRVDVRILAATRTDLEKEIITGTFRDDLFYRLNRLRIELPPLRERKEDILPILQALATREHCVLNLSADAVNFLEDYPYRGNVRELETAVFRMALILNEKQVISAADLEKIMKQKNTGSARKKSEITTETIKAALADNDYNISQTAVSLGLSRQGLYNKMKKSDITVQAT